ncbi:hypothetical protein H0G86_008910 [Trichoderma simmonsii]|uniref:Uncharacterized protein n=1 Tax=Trichoderma simmonsii TaxID=1491479 RepID=A0A8G0PIK2_9HYPO|nr:hypothetical protein H0G86_008910 [Trichoderma simmonsii]
MPLSRIKPPMNVMGDGLIVGDCLVGITPYSTCRNIKEASSVLHEPDAFIPLPCNSFAIPFCHSRGFVFANSFLVYEWFNYALRQYENSSDDKFQPNNPQVYVITRAKAQP